MSKPIQTINRYKADLREMFFLLFEQFEVQSLLGQAPYEAWGEDEARTTLTECYRWVREVLGPLNVTGDIEGCRIEDGRVLTPKGFKEAWKKLYEAGWKSIGVSPEHGGGGAPQSLRVLMEELQSGANTAFNMYPGLAFGAAEVIESFGTHDQKERFMTRMLDGRWGGTMCLTEPQAGSDVGAASTSAKKVAGSAAGGTAQGKDGEGYSIKGTKIFISGGDHDLSFEDNVIHLVLARVEGAPAGTKGLTLFIVPRVREDGTPNDVQVTSLEHKMGINGSATCVVNFGDNDGCIGFPVGGEEQLNRGMPQMFKMMNMARIAVGIQGVSLASTAYLNALDYAKERKQGASMAHWKDATAPRVAILEHADVRRMLLDMKARVEGIRALTIKLADHQDRAVALAKTDEKAAAYHQGQVDLLVPLVKSYGSDQAFRICETAIQVYGGAGYTRDYPVEQYCRDSKIFSIYEGTNHIQSMDLVGRKLGQAGGANVQAFAADVGKFVAENSGHAVLGASVKKLGEALTSVTNTAMQLLMWFQTGNVAMVPLVSTRFLDMMSELSVSWMLLQAAVIADKKREGLAADHPDAAFYTGKIHAAVYYAHNVLPGVLEKAQVLSAEDKSALEIPDAAFATV